MLIILAVIVILGVIFLMIFNSRSTRRAAEARAAQTAETEREPVLLQQDEHTEGQLLDSSDPVEYTEPDGSRETETELRETIEVSHQARQQETQTKGNDSEYRQALLHFRKPPEPQEEPVESTSNEIEKSADEIYRSALRDMKSKSSPPDSDPK